MRPTLAARPPTPAHFPGPPGRRAAPGRWVSAWKADRCGEAGSVYCLHSGRDGLGPSRELRWTWTGPRPHQALRVPALLSVWALQRGRVQCQ